MKKMHLIKGIIVTAVVYSVAALLIFAFTDAHIVIRMLGVVAAIGADIVWKWKKTGEMLDEMIEELEVDKK